MQLGMVGLGRMGANMVRRLMKAGHDCVVFDRSPQAVADLVKEKAVGASSVKEFVSKLQKPRAIWLMIPAAYVDSTIAEIVPFLEAGDILIDGGNSYYIDDIRRAKDLAPKGIHYVDVGTSGGVWGLERGYCMMIGGPEAAVKYLDPIFKTIAPGIGDIPRTPGREKLGGTAEQGYLHCGPSGGGHFVKMVHNGIEYGIMAAYAEGLNIIRSANAGKQKHEIDAETTPLRDPEHYPVRLQPGGCYRGVAAGQRNRFLAPGSDRISAGRRSSALEVCRASVGFRRRGWTIKTSIDEAVPSPVLTTALYERFSSRGEADFADKLLSAMRYEFGGHLEKAAGK
jgi:6-phosphogluconate dehydrogenase